VVERLSRPQSPTAVLSRRSYFVHGLVSDTVSEVRRSFHTRGGLLGPIGREPGGQKDIPPATLVAAGMLDVFKCTG